MPGPTTRQLLQTLKFLVLFEKVKKDSLIADKVLADRIDECISGLKPGIAMEQVGPINTQFVIDGENEARRAAGLPELSRGGGLFMSADVDGEKLNLAIAESQRLALELQELGLVENIEKMV